MNALLSWAPLVARILVGGTFIWAGYQKIVGYAGMVTFAGTALPAPEAAIVVAIVVEILGGLSVLLGYKIKWGALALAVFTVVASLAFHADFANQVQMMFFIKNMGIVAALLYMAQFGAGKYSMDK
ncbi:hypothetical protein A3D62_00530 [Candidatus Kaiserbacteria bacterium RIFCSPHIGHO2_02_FULL_49_11]|uniref:DoxX family protein n=1 Tax=Candidatus Kaiserbacteria bacterium RIFCSPHIGHO2_02_FULL_49_11 TaxID=1798489 RepID=A0A1F6CYZ7_9BACT|nr:MAG: hypothetical protein A3D62_00530 [Candidatus Kaiserbacteria bacterium RIFCSPHIGHO2_02_FULL_49_11]